MGHKDGTRVNVFYCIKCDQLVAIEQARTLFRTGYYCNEYPLGCCTDCFPEPQQQVNEENSMISS